MDNYQCQKCSTLIQGKSMPYGNGCPEGSYHKWTNLGPVGDSNYQCKKCGTVVKMARAPYSIGCPQGSAHQWNKL
jgi:hypothetical protein